MSSQRHKAAGYSLRFIEPSEKGSFFETRPKPDFGLLSGAGLIRLVNGLLEEQRGILPQDASLAHNEFFPLFYLFASGIPLNLCFGHDYSLPVPESSPSHVPAGIQERQHQLENQNLAFADFKGITFGFHYPEGLYVLIHRKLLFCCAG